MRTSCLDMTARNALIPAYCDPLLEPPAAPLPRAPSSTTASTSPTPPRRCSRRSPASASRSASSRTSSGVEVFVRQGKRLASLTPAGEIVVATARRALREIANLKRVADEFRSEDDRRALDRDHAHAGALRAAEGAAGVRRRATRRCGSCCTRATRCRSPSRRRAATPTRHRDRGARRLSRARRRCPATTGTACVLVPDGASAGEGQGKLTLEALARYPIVTYDFAFTGRSQINAAFAARRARAQRRADRARRRRHQDLRRARHGRRHRRADGLRPVARRRVRLPRRDPPVRASRRRGSRCAATCSCAATSTRSSRCSRRTTRAAVDAALAGKAAPAIV